MESLAGEATRKFNSCTDVCEPIEIFKGLLENITLNIIMLATEIRFGE